MADNLFIPADPLSVPFRPLNKGMVTTVSTLGMPDGSLFDIKNARMSANGPRRVGYWEPQALGFVPLFGADEFPLRIEPFMWADGSLTSVLVTNHGLYELEYSVSATTITPVVMTTKVTSYVQTNENFVTTGTTFVTDGIASEDMVHFTDDDSYWEIDTVVELGFSLVSDPDVHTGEIEFVKKFHPEEGMPVQSASLTRASLAYTLLVDGPFGGIWRYDGELRKHTLTNVNNVENITQARTIGAFKDMFYFGAVVDAGDWLPNRTVWTQVLDPTKVAASSYVDTQVKLGEIMGISVFGAQIVLVHTAGFSLGRQTNLTGLPYAFNPMDTGAIAAISPTALAVFLETLVFVAHDNIYVINQNSGFSPISDAISSTIREEIELSTASTLPITVIADTAREQLLFNFPRGTSYVKTLSYNYRTQAFSWFITSSFYMLSISPLGDSLMIQELDMLIQDMDMAILSLNGTRIDHQLIRLEELGATGRFSLYAEFTDSAHPLFMETGDLDFSQPDTDKSLLRVGLKINDQIVPNARNYPIMFDVEASVTRGKTWLYLGQIYIEDTYSEDSVTCRLFGSHFRLRFTQVIPNAETCIPFEVNEIVLRVRNRAIEASAEG